MSRNPYSNLSHEELLKLLAEKDAQLEKSSTEIRTLREEKQVQKELMAQETERLQGKVYDLEQKNRQMTVKLAQMGLAVNEVLPVLQLGWGSKTGPANSRGSGGVISLP